MLIHPTLDQLHQLGLAGMARAFTELEANPQSAELSHAEWLALLLDREATERISDDGGRDCAMPACVTRLPWRTSITAPLVGLTVRCSRP